MSFPPGSRGWEQNTRLKPVPMSPLDIGVHLKRFTCLVTKDKTADFLRGSKLNDHVSE